jgi:hypothetical protein
VQIENVGVQVEAVAGRHGEAVQVGRRQRRLRGPWPDECTQIQNAVHCCMAINAPGGILAPW